MWLIFVKVLLNNEKKYALISSRSSFTFILYGSVRSVKLSKIERKRKTQCAFDYLLNTITGAGTLKINYNNINKWKLLNLWLNDCKMSIYLMKYRLNAVNNNTCTFCLSVSVTHSLLPHRACKTIKYYI